MIATLRSMLRDRRELALENLALRQQHAILARTHPHRRLRKTDRLFWVWLSRMWKSWQESLIVVKPDTVVRWHRKGFALYWTRLSRENHVGRAGTRKEIRDLIRKIASANPLWGSPRVHGELLKLGIHISERLLGTVRRDCLNHVIVLGEAHLRRTLTLYFRYYHNFRTHLSLEKDAPAPRAVQDAKLGPVIEVSEVGGLHHHYERRAA